MLYLKCTADVQKHIGLPKSQMFPAVPSDAPLGNWMVNRFPIERRQAFIFMSESTLLSFILLKGRVGLTPQRLPEMLLAGLEQLLQMKGFAQADIDRALEHYLVVGYAKNDNRAAMGCMNDLVWRYQDTIDFKGGLDYCDLTEIIFKINDTPQRTLGWASSWDVVQSKLRRLS